MMAVFLARPIALPPKQIPVTVIQATRVRPPFLTDEVKKALGLSYF